RMACAGLVLLTASRPTACGSRCEACAASRIRLRTFAIFSAIVDITCALWPARQGLRHSTRLHWIGESHGYYRAARLQRQAGRVGPAPLGGPAADDSRRWRRTADQPAADGPQTGPRADLRHHERQAAQGLRGIPR